MAEAAKKESARLRDFERSLPMELLKAREAAMARFRPMLAGELARRSFLLAPSLTRILQHLEGEKLVKRTSDANDQRRSVLALTAKGRRVFSEVAPDSAALYENIETEFGAERMEMLYELLGDFHETLNGLEPDSG
jgi:DNA-binding MarR family transcriptional regulator